MENQPTFDLRRYALSYRLFYVSFAMSIAPFVWEALRYWNNSPERFVGTFYYAPFWIVWGCIAVASCAVAVYADTIRAQGMCVSMCGVWYLSRVLVNIFDRTDVERFYFAGQWAAWLFVVGVVSYHLAGVRPQVTHLYRYHQRRLRAYTAAKKELDRQEVARVQAEGQHDA